MYVCAFAYQSKQPPIASPAVSTHPARDIITVNTVNTVVTRIDKKPVQVYIIILPESAVMFVYNINVLMHAVYRHLDHG